MQLGRRVDPVIINALQRGVTPEFRSAITYHFEVGGKRIRAAMAILSCLACGGSLREAVRSGAVVELIHNYSLVMDDIIDHANVRREKPTVRVRAGESVALLVAMQYREVLDDVIDGCQQKSRIRRTAVRTMKEIIDGERLDLLLEQAGRRDPYLISHRVTAPRFGIYLEMIGRKTASLFRASCEIGGIAANCPSKATSGLASYGWNAGLAFQIVDDVLDIFGGKTGKERSKDIVEHKMGNAAVLMALKFLPYRDRAELMRILQTDMVSHHKAERAARLISKTPARRASLEVAESYVRMAQAKLAALGASKHTRRLAQLADSLVERTY